MSTQGDDARLREVCDEIDAEMLKLRADLAAATARADRNEALWLQAEADARAARALLGRLSGESKASPSVKAWLVATDVLAAADAFLAATPPSAPAGTGTQAGEAEVSKFAAALRAELTPIHDSYVANAKAEGPRDRGRANQWWAAAGGVAQALAAITRLERATPPAPVTPGELPEEPGRTSSQIRDEEMEAAVPVEPKEPRK